MAMAMAIPGSTRTPLGQLGMYLFFVATRNPNGDVEADARIASTLGVPPLLYTSNDTDAQTLLPAGWSWSTDSDGVIVCVEHRTGRPPAR
jgi:hypothetical protein